MDVREKIDALKFKRNMAVHSLEKEEEINQEYGEELSASREVQELFQGVASAIQRRIHERVAGIVQKCLQLVFDDPYDFKIEFEERRGKTEAVLTYMRDGETYTDPLQTVGGGVVDVTSLALRLGAVVMSTPQRSRVLVLDEPFRNVRGQNNKDRLGTLLVRLAEKMDFQFILNVDMEAYPEFALGKVIEIEK